MSGEQPYVHVVYRIEEDYLERLPEALAKHVEDGLSSSPWELLVTIKEAFVDPDHAEAEVERLNKLNGHKGCRYFWSSAKFYPEGRKGS
jgi:hypothetical protein